MNPSALSDIKVVEWSESVSGPYCGKLLADLGAEVIKIERPGFGDRSRSYGPFPQDIPHYEKSGLFLYLNTNKKSVTLDVTKATGAEIFRELVKSADVLVENNPPSLVEKLCLNFKNLKKLNKKLIVTSITPFGYTGPYRDHKACELTSFNLSGLAFTNPYVGVDNIEEQPPLKGPPHQGEIIAGLGGAITTMSAIFACNISGFGQHVDISEQEALTSMIRRDLGLYNYEGIIKTRIKGSQPQVEFVMGHCKNGYFYMLCNTDKFWDAWVELMDSPDWTKEAFCQDRASRRENWYKIRPRIEEWSEGQLLEDIVSEAQSRRIPCMPINTIEELYKSELLKDRDYFVEIDHKEAGKIKYPGAPYKLSQTPWHIKSPAPLLGEHNDKILGGQLGYSRKDLVKMRVEGVI
ncbi:MAG: CoA transferase [Spirochaetota bacterium]|nr:CoA transferase [Spirochaetota bacterium]